MQIKRTSNSGVLITIDGVTVLLDGVSKEIYPYLGTPDEIRNEHFENLPDILAFSHFHDDHYDNSYVDYYKKMTKRAVLGPIETSSAKCENVKVECVDTRHIGKNDVPHVSFCITGNKNVWFMGDASPAELKKFNTFSKPDVLIAPYTFANSTSAWRIAKESGAGKIVILHLPHKHCDVYGLWDSVLKIAENDTHLIIPDIGETIIA